MKIPLLNCARNFYTKYFVRFLTCKMADIEKLNGGTVIMTSQKSGIGKPLAFRISKKTNTETTSQGAPGSKANQETENLQSSFESQSENKELLKSMFTGKRGLEFLSSFDEGATVSKHLRSDQLLLKKLGACFGEDCSRGYIFTGRCESSESKLVHKGLFVPYSSPRQNGNENGTEASEMLKSVKQDLCKFSFKINLGKSGEFHVSSDSNDSTPFVLTPVDLPEFNRLYLTKDYNSVYHCYEDAVKILQQNLDIPEVVELLDIAEKYIDPRQRVEELPANLKHPFVVIEGLDATGKSTLTENLAGLLGACQLRTPSDPIRHIRSTFDHLPELIRRAYYALGNYIVSQEIAEKCRTGPVIMDRFWHSTTAYAIANDCDYGTGSEGLPPQGHSVYKWPHDLIKPTLVIFLTVSEQIRKERIAGRNEEMTWEEKKLNQAEIFRKKLLEAYRRMEDPPCLEIDAGVSKEEVADKAKEALIQAGVLKI